MQVDVKSRFHVESEPDLFQSVLWAEEFPGVEVRVVQTCVGPYGAIDQNGGTVYFDIGDHLVLVMGRLVVASEKTMASVISEGQE